MWNASPYFFNQQYQLSQQGVGAFPASLAKSFYLNRWDLGATLGGPIKKDKLSLFCGVPVHVEQRPAHGTFADDGAFRR